MRKLLGLLILAFATCAAAPAGAASERLSTDVVPVLEEIHLRVDPDSSDYGGWVRVTLDVAKSARQMTLHAEGQRIERVTLTQQGRAIPFESERGEQGLLTLTAERPLAHGAATLEIRFTNAFDTHAVGLYRMTKDGLGYLFTQFEANDAREGVPVLGPAVVQDSLANHARGSGAGAGAVEQSDRAHRVECGLEDHRVRGDPSAAELPAGDRGGAARVRRRPGREVPGAHRHRQGSGSPRAAGGDDGGAVGGRARALVRHAVSLPQARPARRAGVLVRRHGERGRHHLRRGAAAGGFHERQRGAAAPAQSGDRARAGAHVVRRPGDHGVVGRSVAQRVVR